MPAIALIRVDLPAPLSPTRATTSPGPTSKSTSVSARTAPKLLLTPFSSSRGVFGPAAGCVAVASVTCLLQLRRGPLAHSLTFLLQAGLLARCGVGLRADLIDRVQAVLDHGVLDLVGRHRDGRQDDRVDLLLAVVGLRVHETGRNGLALGERDCELRSAVGLLLVRLV